MSWVYSTPNRVAQESRPRRHRPESQAVASSESLMSQDRHCTASPARVRPGRGVRHWTDSSYLPLAHYEEVHWGLYYQFYILYTRTYIGILCIRYIFSIWYSKSVLLFIILSQYNKSVLYYKYSTLSLLINIILCKAREGKACPTTVLQMLTCRLALIDSA